MVLNPFLPMCKEVETRLKLSKSLMCHCSYTRMVSFVLKSESKNIFSLLRDKYVSIRRMSSNFSVLLHAPNDFNIYQQLFKKLLILNI